MFYYQDNAKFPLFFTASGYRIENMLNLDQGKAWIGFTSATFGATAAAYIYQFQFQSLPTVSAGVAIICPPDLVVTASARTCTYSGTTGTPTLINLYGGSSVSYSKSPRGPYSPGTKIVTYGATNTPGYLFAYCNQTVSVIAPSSCVL